MLFLNFLRPWFFWFALFTEWMFLCVRVQAAFKIKTLLFTLFFLLFPQRDVPIGSEICSGAPVFRWLGSGRWIYKYIYTIPAMAFPLFLTIVSSCFFWRHSRLGHFFVEHGLTDSVRVPLIYSASWHNSQLQLINTFDFFYLFSLFGAKYLWCLLWFVFFTLFFLLVVRFD